MLGLKCFDAIGFKAPDFAELNHFLDMANLKGHHGSSERGRYAYWRLESGLEIWSAYDGQLRALNNNPHFCGNSCIDVRILEMLDIPASVEGSLKVRLYPADENGPRYPFVFNVPSWDWTRPLLKQKITANPKSPLVVPIQLTAFAECLECFDSPEAFLASQMPEPSTDPHAPPPPHVDPIPPMYFEATGLQGEDPKHPHPTASFIGIVERGRVLHNPATGQDTCCLGVHTLGMTLDVVVDANIVKGRPRKGGVVRGNFWLSGRLREEIEATNKRFNIK